MQRPSSSLSEYSATSSAGASSSFIRRPGLVQRQRPTPGGPRKPTAKSSLPSLLPQAQQQQQEQQDQHQQHRQSQNEQPPSYVQSQHDLQRQRPLQSYTPPPTSAVTSDSSYSHPSMSVFTRAGTPSSMSAFSPVRAMSPAPILESHAEESPAHQLPRQLPLSPSRRAAPGPEIQHARMSTPSTPSISKPPSPRPDSPGSSSAYFKPRIAASLPTPTPLQPPPSVDFSPVPIAWKALTLDAAQWTFSSAELQSIVSRAIRASAEPSSIRLLPLQMLDEELVQEVERLESERAQAVAQYRFTMHRRTMLLQSLNASSGSSNSPSSSTFSGNVVNLSQAPAQTPTADLAQRLAEVSATLDRLASTLLRVSDQLAQIRTLQDVHAASALAVALRKLNASYARRTREVQGLKEKLAAAEEERDEAWRVAEELAMEFDGDEELEEVVKGNVVNGERAVAVPATLTRTSRIDIKIKMPGAGPRVRQRGAEDVPEDETEANAAGSPSSAPGESVGASAPILQRRRANSATSRVTAARTRSIRASKASLRFPRNHEPRPPSAYSQHSSAQSGPSRARSRSRADSTAGSPLDAPSPSSSNAPGGAIPDVPKIPNAVELARLASVKSTASAPTALPPMPPPPIETSPSAIGSFLDMMTRPNSATDDKGKSPEKASAADEDAGVESSVQDLETLKLGDAQANGDAAADGRVDGDEQCDEVAELPAKDLEEDEEAQVISIPPRPPVHRAPFSASQVESSGTDTPKAALAKKQMQARPSLYVYPPTWTRPPPDSPMDVSCGSDPHRADNDDDLEDAEEAELADAFETAYVQTQTRGAIGYSRSPLRMQHAQSMLPFPGTEGRAPFLAGAEREGNGSLKRSPQSDNEIARPFRGTAANASVRRPTSLPSAQGEKPWNYF